MGNPARRDELLEELRRMPFEDREYIQAELTRDDYEAGRYQDPPEVVAEVIRRAEAALANPDSGFTREEAMARVRSRLEARRKRHA